MNQLNKHLGQNICAAVNLIFNFQICRLIKGDGEILEEIVSRDRHGEINKVCLH